MEKGKRTGVPQIHDRISQVTTFLPSAVFTKMPSFDEAGEAELYSSGSRRNGGSLIMCGVVSPNILLLPATITMISL